MQCVSMSSLIFLDRIVKCDCFTGSEIHFVFCDRHGLKEWCMKPYKAIAVLNMSSTLVVG